LVLFGKGEKGKGEKAVPHGSGKSYILFLNFLNFLNFTGKNMLKIANYRS
jgi:hypothetical protein